MRSGIMCPWVFLPDGKRNLSPPLMPQWGLTQSASGWCLPIAEAGSQPPWPMKRLTGVLLVVTATGNCILLPPSGGAHSSRHQPGHSLRPQFYLRLGGAGVKVEGQLGPKPFTNADRVGEPHVNSTAKRRLPAEGTLRTSSVLLEGTRTPNVLYWSGRSTAGAGHRAGQI